MATYFKYAEREADSQINWAEIGKSMSDMLAEQNRIREEKKAEIDKASQEYGELLSNPPQGEFKAMNQWTIEYANDYQQSRLMQDKLLKSGQLKMKDYMVMRQNSTDGTNQLFDLSKQYQEVYKAKMDRRNVNDNQLLEMKLMADAEGLANFMDTKAYINPTDGTVSIGKMVTGPDGVKKMSSNPDDFMSVTALGNSIKDNYDRFKSTEAVAGYVEGLGAQIDVITSIKNKYQRGTITEILDITQRENLPTDAKGVVMKFEEAETAWLKSFLTDELHVTSILTEDIKTAPNGKPYDYTWDEKVAAANPEMILLKNNSAGRPVPFPTPEQEKAALESLRVKARLMYDKKESVSVVAANEVPRPTQAETDAANARKVKQSLLQDWQLVRNGTDEQKKAALDAIKGSPTMIARGLTNIYIQDDKVFFEYTDPRMNTKVDISNNAEAFFRAGKEVYGETTEEELAKYSTGQKVNPTTQISASRGQEMNYQEGLKADVNDIFIDEDVPANTASRLTSEFGRLGFTFTPKSEFSTLKGGKIDSVIIKAADGTEGEYNIDDQNQLQAIKDFIINNANPDKAQAIYGTKGSSSSKSSTSSKKGAGDAVFKKG